jgi:NAD-dependent SIR2 family protein deacetylase
MPDDNQVTLDLAIEAVECYECDWQGRSDELKTVERPGDGSVVYECPKCRKPLMFGEVD